MTPAASGVKVRVKESHRYGDLLVHDGIEFDVRENEFVCVVGQSGCGKSTLLDILSGMLKPTEGHVLIDGVAADPKKQDISFVFQEPSNLPWLTVWDNVATGLRIKKYPKAEIARIVDEVIGVVGLRGFEKYYPHQISGGMKQRVAIARAFATDADVILMDEPFVSLDQHTRETMQQEILDIWRLRKRTIIFVTHNLEEAVFLGDRVIVLSNKPARVQEDMRIDLPRPRDMLSHDFNALRVKCAAVLNGTRQRQPETASVRYQNTDIS